MTMTLLFLMLFHPGAETKADFKTTLEKHLAAVRTQNYEDLAATLRAPGGDMTLILPDGKRTETVAMFLEMHKAWFAQKGWTMDHKIVEMHQGEDMGYALVRADYREADRDGKPYRNVLLVNMILRREADRWVVVFDQGTAVKKP